MQRAGVIICFNIKSWMPEFFNCGNLIHLLFCMKKNFSSYKVFFHEIHLKSDPSSSFISVPLIQYDTITSFPSQQRFFFFQFYFINIFAVDFCARFFFCGTFLRLFKMLYHPCTTHGFHTFCT